MNTLLSPYLIVKLILNWSSNKSQGILFFEFSGAWTSSIYGNLEDNFLWFSHHNDFAS